MIITARERTITVDDREFILPEGWSCGFEHDSDFTSMFSIHVPDSEGKVFCWTKEKHDLNKAELFVRIIEAFLDYCESRGGVL